MLSPVLFCIYIVELLSLAKAGVGCYMGDVFLGAIAYSDDSVLVDPSATTLQKDLQILTICDDYA